MLVKEPVYLQLNHELRKVIRQDRLSAGARFFTEREVSSRFGVSRTTANKALSSLVAEGLLEFRKGIGTFVRGEALDYDLRTPVCFDFLNQVVEETCMDQIGVAVVGAGFIGPVHVEALRRLGLPVRGILGCDQAESQRAMKSLGLPKAYASLEEVLADPTVQSVHLAVPNVLHYEFAKRAIAAGKHVMCEKPLAMTAAQSGELVELAAGKRLAAGVCYNIRFYPLNLEARERIAGGELGRIFAVNGSYAQDWLLEETDYNWRVLADQGGQLRAVADIGTHWMDLVSSITGLEIEAVLADLFTVHPVRQRPKGEVEILKSHRQQSWVSLREISA